MGNMREFEASDGTPAGTGAFPLGGRLKRRTLFVALGVAGVASGLYLGWESLVAAGLAPILLAVVPCAAMCALGLCADRLGRKDACASSGEPSGPKVPDGLRSASTADPGSGLPPAGRSDA
jgi:hypothetical protein